TLTGVTVTDPLTGDPVSADTLAVGASEDLSASYTLLQADIDTPAGPHSITNTATADSDQTDPTDSSVDTPIDYAPGISVEKKADVASVDSAGDIITYTITVENTGDVSLTGITVTDQVAGHSAITLDIDGSTLTTTD